MSQIANTADSQAFTIDIFPAHQNELVMGRLQDIRSAFAAALNTEKGALTGKGGLKNTGKKVTLYLTLIKQYTGLINQEIGTVFRGMHYTAVSKASARLQTEMSKDQRLRDLAVIDPEKSDELNVLTACEIKV